MILSSKATGLIFRLQTLKDPKGIPFRYASEIENLLSTWDKRNDIDTINAARVLTSYLEKQDYFLQVCNQVREKLQSLPDEPIDQLPSGYLMVAYLCDKYMVLDFLKNKK